MDTEMLKAKVQGLNEFGNTYSGLLAVAGLALTALFLFKRGR